MFEITVKKRFTASHSIKFPNGEWEKTHSHNWLVEVNLASDSLDSAGCVVDFYVVEGVLDKIIAEIENKNLNDTKAFEGKKTSAEVIAQFFFEKLTAQLENTTARMLSKVTIWEDEFHGASFVRS